MSCVDEMHTFPDVRLQLSVSGCVAARTDRVVAPGCSDLTPMWPDPRRGEQMCSACMSDSCRRPHSSAVHLVCSLGSAGP